MAARILSLALKPARIVRPLTRSKYSSKYLIGNREVVGHGMNGEPFYQDRLDYPFPSIRFKEDTPDILALREKEKDDWKKLSMEEKKTLYRASFCMTFAELKYPSNEWRECIGWALVCISVAIWVQLWMAAYIYYDHPETMTEERKKAQLKRILDLEVNPIFGISSKWDYENERWK